MRFHHLLSLTAFGLMISTAAAEPTPVTVRVLSKDAKFIGTGMGGMKITIRDAASGKELATGVTEGGTGDTGRIMHKDGGRRAAMADGKAAGFTATLDLDAPRLIEVEAFGPLGHQAAAHRVLSSQWVVPGQDLSAGEGWVLELPGLVVESLTPAETKAGGVEIGTRVVMMCGCPIEAGGLWDAAAFKVAAQLAPVEGNTAPIRGDLGFSGKTSIFSGTLPKVAPGRYRLTITAIQTSTGNAGAATGELTVR